MDISFAPVPPIGSISPPRNRRLLLPAMAAVLVILAPEMAVAQAPPPVEFSCAEPGVECRGASIVSVGLPRQPERFGGVFPESIRSLHTLERLVLYENELEGPLPAWLGELSQLRVLDLRRNRLAGEIPSALAALRQLRELKLGYNHLEGSIPPWIGELPELRELSLGGNRLRGPLPERWPAPSKLRYLDLSDLGLDSEFPEQILGFEALRTLAINNAGLRGPIPEGLAGLTELEWLELRWNFLDGPLPKALEGLTRMARFDLSHNRLAGELELDFAHWQKLSFLALSHNRFSGPLPSSLAGLPNLRSLDYSETSICEPDDPAVRRWLDQASYFRRSLDPCAPEPLEAWGNAAFTADRDAFEGLRMRVEWMMEPHAGGYLGWIHRFELDVDPAAVPERAISICTVIQVVTLPEDPRLLTLFDCGGFEIAPFALAVWEPDESDSTRLRLRTLGRLMPTTAIGRLEVEAVVDVEEETGRAGSLLLVGSDRGGDGGEAWGTIWAALLEPPSRFRMLYRSPSLDWLNSPIERRHHLDPTTLELVIRTRDWSVRDDLHDGSDWPPTEEERIDLHGRLR